MRLLPPWRPRTVLLLAPFVLTRLLSAFADAPATIPWAVRGSWIVTENLSEHTLGCFDPAHADGLVGLHVNIDARRLIWNRLPSDDLEPQISTLSSYAFSARYGKLPQELGLRPAEVSIIDVHPSKGVPVNAIVSINPTTILIDACNIWLRARRNEPAVGE